jgi:hypothetical protein
MFVSSQAISGSSGSTTGSNVDATKEPGEPQHAGNPGGASVWYSWTAPASGDTTITTEGSSFDTLLGVYTGSSVGSLTEVTSNDDANFPLDSTSSVTFNASAGTTYRIAVDGYDGPQSGLHEGSVALNWSEMTGPRPSNGELPLALQRTRHVGLLERDAEAELRRLLDGSAVDGR